MKENDIERVELKEEKLWGALERVRAALGEDIYNTLKDVVDTLLFVTRLLEKKRMTIRRLRKLIFGSQSEKKRKLWGRRKDSEGEGGEGEEGGEGRSTDPDKASGKSPEEAGSGEEKSNGGDGGEEKKRAKGHGRNGARFLRCGDPHFGFLRLRCTNADCPRKEDRILPFS